MSSTLDSKAFAIWLKNILEAKKLSYRKIEENSNNEISRSYISLLIKAESMPGDLSLCKIVALSEGLQIPIQEVFESALKTYLQMKQQSSNGMEIALKSNSKIPLLKEKKTKTQKKAG
ncbi:MAG TPA: helix-turn-helix transcriptional regulator [Pyrinomonadaceae bacterium]|nr:helix-turn-helix transcriptional regulator [Pyrinomonadaceae bacterium]